MDSHSRLAAILVFCVVVVGLLGCTKQPVAVVGQHKITRAELLDKLEKDQGREALLAMINEMLLEDAFTESGLTVSDTEVQEQVDKLKERMGSPEAFSRWLTAQGWSEQDLLDRMTMDMKLRKLCTRDVKVDEKGLKEFFEQYKPMFAKREQVIYSEIVVETQDEAKKIAEELKKPDADFGKLARQHSTSTMSRESGGQLPPMPRDQIAPPTVAEAVLALKPGQVSAPLEIEGRWYLLKLNELTAARDADFEKDKADIEEAFKYQQAKQPQDLLKELREKASVNVIDPKYSDINDMFRPSPELPEFGSSDAPAGAGGAQPPAGKAPAPAKPADAQ